MQRLLDVPERAAFCTAKTDAVEVTDDGAEGNEDQDVVEVGGESSSNFEMMMMLMLKRKLMITMMMMTRMTRIMLFPSRLRSKQKQQQCRSLAYALHTPWRGL